MKKLFIPVLMIILGYGGIIWLAGARWGDGNSAGHIADAETKLLVGQTYECVSSLVQVDGERWYVIVKADNKYLGLKFKEQPPIQGVVAKQNGKIVFLPLAPSGTTIPNPIGK